MTNIFFMTNSAFISTVKHLAWFFSSFTETDEEYNFK